METELLESPDEDIQLVQEVAEYLGKHYVEQWDQGPIWITGSSLHTSEPGDYDIVVERSFQQLPTEADQRAVAKLLNEFQDEEIDYEAGLSELNQRLEDSEYIDTGNNVNLYPEPVRRFQIEINGADIDLSFNNEEPYDEALKLFN